MHPSPSFLVRRFIATSACLDVEDEVRVRPTLDPARDPRGVFSIQLLHLEPSTNRTTKLHCRLAETQIPDYDYLCQQSTSTAHVKCEYQALSYTWGEPQFRQPLHVLPAGVINITENLHSALQTPRKPDRTPVLWVDAV
jgi:hypothetical protein